LIDKIRIFADRTPQTLPVNQHQKTEKINAQSAKAVGVQLIGNQLIVT
jgi:hypothetical protein